VPDVSGLLRENLRDALAADLACAGTEPVLLWLDDVRPAPDGWVHARSVNEAVAVLEAGGVAFASLDHDLGDFAGDGGDGARLTDWMAFHDVWPSQGLRVHSSNPVGVATMLATADRHSGLGGRFGSARGVAPEGGWPPALMR
jgi:hypothetical protein